MKHPQASFVSRFIRNLRQKWYRASRAFWPKDRNCDICLRTKITRTLCRKHWQSSTSSRKWWWLDSSRSQRVLSEECESRNNHQYAVAVQDLATPWLQSYPCKTKSSQETERSLRKVVEPSDKPKVIYTGTIPWNLAKSVKNYPGIIVHHGLIVSRQLILLREQYAALGKGRLQYCCNQVWMKNGGRIPWNVTAICEMFKTWKHLMKGDLEKHSKDVTLFESMIEYHPNSAKDQSRQFGKKVLSGIYLVYVLHARRHLGRRHVIMVVDTEELENLDASDVHARRLNAKEVLMPKNGETAIFPVADGTAKLVVWKRSGFPKIHLNSGLSCTRRWAERRSSRRLGRVSTIWHANGWQWRPKRCFVDDLEVYRVSRWLGPLDWDLGPKKRFFQALGMRPSAENVGKTQEKCKHNALGKKTVFGPFFGPWMSISCQRWSPCFDNFPNVSCVLCIFSPHNTTQHTPILHACLWFSFGFSVFFHTRTHMHMQTDRYLACGLSKSVCVNTRKTVK